MTLQEILTKHFDQKQVRYEVLSHKHLQYVPKEALLHVREDGLVLAAESETWIDLSGVRNHIEFLHFNVLTFKLQYGLIIDTLSRRVQVVHKFMTDVSKTEAMEINKRLSS